MPESTRPRIQLVLDRYLPGTSIESIGPLEGGVSATMAKVHVRLPDGNSGSVVVRTPGKWTQEEPPGFIEREFDTLQKVHRAGILSPKPVGLEPPGPEDRFYLLEYIVGAPLLNPSDPAGFGCRFAELHAMIHGLDLEQNGLLEIRRLPTKIRQAGKGAGQSLQEEEIRAALGGEEVLADVNPPVFRHGDLWPGNVVWLDGVVSGIVDWENASIGEPLFDLAITRLDLLWVAGWPATEVFTERYLELRPIDGSQLPKFDLAAAMRLGGELELIAASYPPLGRDDITVETLTRDLAEFVQRALNRL